jgi:hypothetical protein
MEVNFGNRAVSFLCTVKQTQMAGIPPARTARTVENRSPFANSAPHSTGEFLSLDLPKGVEQPVIMCAAPSNHR